MKHNDGIFWLFPPFALFIFTIFGRDILRIYGIQQEENLIIQKVCIILIILTIAYLLIRESTMRQMKTEGGAISSQTNFIEIFPNVLLLSIFGAGFVCDVITTAIGFYEALSKFDEHDVVSATFAILFTCILFAITMISPIIFGKRRIKWLLKVPIACTFFIAAIVDLATSVNGILSLKKIPYLISFPGLLIVWGAFTLFLCQYYFVRDALGLSSLYSSVFKTTARMEESDESMLP